jgi:hypothetical protein
MNIENKNGTLKVIAFYLPQFYPILENDRFFGKGFTEWTNVTKAKPLFKGHVQPQLPSELGFYDLRVPEVREQQAVLAREAGIHGFCYWHYWFGNGKRVLERVFNEVVESGNPDFPFCLGWANDSWTGRWHGLDNKVNIEQCYPGEEDYIKHFYEVLPAFKDKRYIKKDGKPIFYVYRAEELPDPNEFISCWRKLAEKEGLGNIFFIAGARDWDYKKHGFDAYVLPAPAREANIVALNKKVNGELAEKLIKNDFVKKMANSNFVKDMMARRGPMRIQYKDYINLVDSRSHEVGEVPIVLSNWDNTPRSARRGLVIENSTPELFGKHLENTVNKLSSMEDNIIFLKSWNEWAEGNFLEPSREFGRSYLEKCAEVLKS